MSPLGRTLGVYGGYMNIKDMGWVEFARFRVGQSVGFLWWGNYLSHNVENFLTTRLVIECSRRIMSHELCSF
jgi:hypothetical protein